MVLNRIILLTLFVTANTNVFAVGPGNSIIQLVTIPEYEITNLSGKNCEIRFFLREDALITVEIINAYDQLVKTIVKNKEYKRGTVSIFWDGKNDDGKDVPSFAYIPLVYAVDSEKNHFVYDPRSSTGWNKLVVKSPVYDQKQERIVFETKQHSYVRMRIGSQEGPLYSTPINWQFYFSGKHSYQWDGLDESDKVILTEKKIEFILQTMSLPEETIYIMNSHSKDKVTKNDTKAIVKPIHYEDYVGEVKANPLRRMMEKGELPRFDVSLPQSHMNEDGIVEISGKAPVRIDIDKRDIEWLTSARYETLIWVDGIYVAEEEEGYAPYSWILDTAKYQNGYHILTVMIQSFTDRIGTRNIWIDIQN